jgi:hypothetical protein
MLYSRSERLNAGRWAASSVNAGSFIGSDVGGEGRAADACLGCGWKRMQVRPADVDAGCPSMNARQTARMQARQSAPRRQGLGHMPSFCAHKAWRPNKVFQRTPLRVEQDRGFFDGWKRLAGVPDL